MQDSKQFGHKERGNNVIRDYYTGSKYKRERENKYSYFGWIVTIWLKNSLTGLSFWAPKIW